MTDARIFYISGMNQEVFCSILYGWMALALIVFFILLRLKVPYGRHATDKWGPGIPNKWAWFVMELPALLSFSLFLFGSAKPLPYQAYVVYGLYVIHYFRRTFIYPFRLHDNGKKMPVLVVLLGIGFNVMNGFLNGYWLANFAPDYGLDWYRDPRFIAGLSIFVVGMYLNIKSDDIVLNLRKGGKKGYYIPQQGLYRYVSAPNLLGEIIEWCGWALLAWSLPAFSFALWSMANLIPRALDHHRWYRERFPEYPKDRKAILPGIL